MGVVLVHGLGNFNVSLTTIHAMMAIIAVAPAVIQSATVAEDVLDT